MSECDICEAKIKPYQDREPCDAEKHVEKCLNPGCKDKQIYSKYGRLKTSHCKECHHVKNFQCGFCRARFFTSASAEQHILNAHHTELKTNLTCNLCHLENKFLIERENDPFLSTTKFLNTEMDIRQMEEEFNNLCLVQNEPKKHPEDSEKVDLTDTKQFPPL